MTVTKWQTSNSFKDPDLSYWDAQKRLLVLLCLLLCQAEGAVDKAFWTTFRFNMDRILFISM